MEPFRLVNSGMPVPAKYFDAELRTLAEQLATRVAARWPRALAASAACRRPRFSRATLIEAFCGDAYHRLLRDDRIEVDGALRCLEALDAEARDLYAAAPRVAHQRYGTADLGTLLPAAEKTGFYAGLNPVWPDDLAAALTRAAVARDMAAQAYAP